MRLETLSCDKAVGGKSDSQYRSSVSSNCNGESRTRPTESAYISAKAVGQLDEVTAVKKENIEKINTYKSPFSFGKGKAIKTKGRDDCDINFQKIYMLR